MICKKASVHFTSAFEITALLSYHKYYFEISLFSLFIRRKYEKNEPYLKVTKQVVKIKTDAF